MSSSGLGSVEQDIPRKSDAGHAPFKGGIELVTHHLSLVTAFMTDRWQQIEKLCHSALELEESQRAAFLEEGLRWRRSSASRSGVSAPV